MALEGILASYEGIFGAWAGNLAYGATNFLAQMFTPAVNADCTSVRLFLYNGGIASGGNVTIEIQGVDGSDHPDNTALATTTVAVDDVAAAPGDWITATFSSPASLVAGTQYAIVVKALTCTAVGADYIQWGLYVVAPHTYGQGEATTDGGTTWLNFGFNLDFNFYLYGTFSTSPDITHTKKLVAVAGNELWCESTVGTMSVLAASQTAGELNVGEPLSMCEAYGKIFIANNARKKVADFTNVKLHTTDIQPAGKVYPRHGTVIEGDTSKARMVVDYITDLDGDTYVYGQRITTVTFVDTDVCEATIDAGAVSFTLDADEVAGPHWYDWTSYGNAADDDTTYGELPEKVGLIGNYRGRAMVSGDPDHPHQWYMPRQGNPWDWVYSSTDAQSAVAGHNCDMGEIGDVVVALIPFKDDYLVIGCASTMWYMTGDPMEGGSLTELDLTTGMYGSRAYCWDGEGNLYFWGANGIYKTTIPGRPVCISQIRLPDLINDVAANAYTHRITLAYDRKRVGILICITLVSDGSNQNYWLDLRSEGFFPETYPEECGVFSAFYYEALNPAYQKLILGGNDGHLRIFDPTAKDDDIGTLASPATEEIQSYISYGPISLSDGPKHMGKVVGLDVETAGGPTGGTDSDDITAKIFIDKSGMGLIKKLIANTGPNFSGTVTAFGRRRGSSIKRKLTGNYAGVRLENLTAAETWGLEQLWLDVKKSGKFK